MVIIPSVNIAEEFYTNLSDISEVSKPLRLRAKEDAFREFHKAVHNSTEFEIANEINIIITTYHTASKCLGDLIEEYYEKEQRLDYFLVIDGMHELLQQPGLIDTIKEFDKVVFKSATADDINHMAYFRNYINANPRINEIYNQNIYANKLIPDATEQRATIVKLINSKQMNYDKILVKIEDKNECKILKELLKYRYKVALNTNDDKEIVLCVDGLFDKNVDGVISTSSIQNGQPIKENILSIFVQTYIDIVSSVKQFLGGNRNRYYDVYLCSIWKAYEAEELLDTK